MNISNKQLEEILKNAPKGTTRDGIIKALISRGNKIEGVSELNPLQKAGQFLVGAGKSALSTAKNIADIGSNVAQTVLAPGTSSLGKANLGTRISSGYEKALGVKKGELTTPTNKYQEYGKTAEQIAEFAIPATKVSKATKLLSTVQKISTRAITSGGVATAQEGKIGKESAIAAGTEIALPVVGNMLKPVTRVIGRLFTGLGAGLSGVSTDTLKTISSNPKTAIEVSKKILREGQESVLENNARTILNGVSKIRQDARSLYGKGLETLKGVDIKPEVITKNTVSSLEKNGVKILDDGIDLTNSEILDIRIQDRAKGVINMINGQTTADGKGLRSVIEKIESSKFKSGLQDPDRMSFNVLMDDLSKGLKTSINESTDKLKEIDKSFSTDMDLADGIQKIFGKVKFKNTSELNSVARKLETLFNQKGLDPKTVDNFLTKIGINPSEFKTSEAIRTITNKTTGANTKGLSIGEITQQVTSSVVTPNTVKNIAIYAGLTSKQVSAIINSVAPSARATIIKALIEANKK